MVCITLRVIDGADRGREFLELQTPVTIGREEGNTIQLNDERVSRYHVKIQEDNEKLVLTDLESTNGTKVNGEDIQLRILRYGDLITCGRSVLLFGSREQIAGRLSQLRGSPALDNASASGSLKAEELARAVPYDSFELELNWSQDADLQATLHALEPPELPLRLTPGQAAQLSELLEYLHIRIRHLINSVKVDGKSQRVTLDLRKWQNLIDLQSRLAEYLRIIGDPQGDDER